MKCSSPLKQTMQDALTQHINISQYITRSVYYDHGKIPHCGKDRIKQVSQVQASFRFIFSKRSKSNWQKKKKKNTQPHKQKKKKHKTKSVFHMPEESRIALTSKDGQIHGLKDIIRAPYFPALFSVSLFVGPFILRQNSFWKYIESQIQDCNKVVLSYK